MLSFGRALCRGGWMEVRWRIICMAGQNMDDDGCTWLTGCTRMMMTMIVAME